MLEFKNVSIGYGKKPIVNNINAHFEKGMVVTIVGKNGSGKSTILRSLYGMSKILSGEIFMDGKNNSSIGPSIRSQKLSALFAGQQVSKEILVDDILDFSIDRRCLSDQEKVETRNKYINLFNIKKFLGRSVNSLSDGMLQRVLITRAFCLETPIVFLDEPTTYLDIESQIEIASIVENLSKEKLILINTHNPIWVKRFSKNIYQVQEGNFIRSSLEDLNLSSR